MSEDQKIDETQDDDKKDDPSSSGNTDDTKDVDDGKTFTQAEIDKLLGKTRSQAASASKKAISEELGMSVDDAKALIAKAAEAEKAQMTEAERMQTEAAEAKAAAEQATAEAKRATVEAQLRSALLTAVDEDNPGIRPDKVDVGVTLGLPQALGEGDDAIAEAVASVREVLPELFTAGPGGSANTGTPGAPGKKGGEQSNKAGTTDAAKKAQEMMEKHGLKKAST